MHRECITSVIYKNRPVQTRELCSTNHKKLFNGSRRGVRAVVGSGIILDPYSDFSSGTRIIFDPQPGILIKADPVRIWPDPVLIMPGPPLIRPDLA
uniref:Uncharacterized protein n=1 Tax=Ditylenchus dipsaci TaxID=166011 RepID=A0A915E581_9BILA